MELAQYLLCVATRHEQAKEEHEDELKELRMRRKGRVGRRGSALTYDDEAALLKGVVGSVRGRPACLKQLTIPALGALAHLFRANMATEPFIQGHEIVDKLVCDPERTIDYLKGFTELKEQGWVRFIEMPGTAFTDQPPFCWLQATMEFGDTFHKVMGERQPETRGFASNDAYLDAVFAYLQTLAEDDSNHYRVTEAGTDLETFQPDGWFRRIIQRVQATTCQLAAAEVQERYGLSTFQHLALVGLLGRRDGDLRYDFSDPADVAHLFARGRVCRRRMREHLFGDKSPLVRQRLVEGSQGAFGESVQLTQLGSRALLGRHDAKRTAQELKKRVRNSTLFDLEEPRVKREALRLPVQVMDAIRSLLYSESREGRRIRKGWQASLSAAWGAPTGSSLLLYGPPGTGKTLTAQYLASELKRPLLKIDAARVLSCWVGESEQNVRRIFDDYAMLQKDLGSAPVLLLNEADQLLGSRGAGSSAVDRMNNNMQNLFLEGLERFAGILVATTNRRDLLDEAFSRRFTYKLELPSPDASLRRQLWQEHLPAGNLDDGVDLDLLAVQNLSGGDIRLVVEKAVRLAAYRGLEKLSQSLLVELAHDELRTKLKRDGVAGNIGFRCDCSPGRIAS